MDELVSIVMPVHNAERYLEDAIRSVISHTYSNWELLVIDDASTDSSKEIATRIAQTDERIKVGSNPTPTGYPASPRNIAIDMAKGRYIAFLDSDDVWLPNKLEHQLQYFNDHEHCGVVFSNYEKVDESLTRASRTVKANGVVNYRKLLLGNVIGNVTAIYDTKEIGKVHFKKVRHEDYAMWLSILRRGFKAHNTGEVVALYRVTNSSVSANKLHLLRWQWDIYRKVEHLGLLRSIYCYANYAIRGYIKSLI